MNGGVDCAKIHARILTPPVLALPVVEGQKQNRTTGNVTMKVLLRDNMGKAMMKYDRKKITAINHRRRWMSQDE